MAFSLGNFNLASVNSVIFSWLTSFMFWIILAFIVFIFTWGALLIRKKRKLCYPCDIETDLGGGKIGRERTKAGWFKSKTAIFGLFDYSGEERLKTKDGRIIQNASAEDFHELDGTRGIICVRKGDDPEVLLPANKVGTSNRYKKRENNELIPIKNMQVINATLLYEIAPADYRDASVKIIKDSAEETRGKYDKLLNVIMYASVGIIFLICIILITKMVKEGQASAQQFSIDSMKTAKEYCVNAIAGSSP